MTRKVRITFDPRYCRPILDGDKTATIRYGYDRPTEAGDALFMSTPDGEHFATAHVERVVLMTAVDAAATDLPGHRDYADVWDLLDHLRPFYPDADLTPNTDLTVIGWREAHEPGAFCEWCRVGPPARWSA